MPATRIPAEALTQTIAETLSEIVDAYEVAGRSPHTVTTFTTHVGRLARFLASDGITDLDAVTTAHVRSFLSAERKRGLRAASLSVSLRTIRRFFGWSVEQGYLTVNPAKAVESPSVVVEPVKFLADDDLDTLLAVIGKDRTVEGVRDTALIRVLMDTGLRRGEVMGLRVTDISLDDPTMPTVTVRAVTSKTRTGRAVPLSDETVKHLRTYLKVRAAFLKRNGREGDDALWIAAKGTLSANGALQMFHRRLEAAGLPKHSLHSLRHRMAAQAIEQQMPMTYLMKIGGWTNPAMPTARYGQYGAEARAMAAMRAHLNR